MFNYEEMVHWLCRAPHLEAPGSRRTLKQGGVLMCGVLMCLSNPGVQKALLLFDPAFLVFLHNALNLSRLLT